MYILSSFNSYSHSGGPWYAIYTGKKIQQALRQCHNYPESGKPKWQYTEGGGYWWGSLYKSFHKKPPIDGEKIVSIFHYIGSGAGQLWACNLI